MKKARISSTPTTQLQSESVQEQERYIYYIHCACNIQDMNNTEDVNYYSGLQLGLNFFFGVQYDIIQMYLQ